MLIAGCVWLGAKERGAFGFSNEKSLMYCPSTLSCAWPCGGLALGAGPPLPPVVAIDSTSHCPQLPQSAAWLTQALRSDKDIRRRAWIYADGGGPQSGHGVPFAGQSSMTRSLRGCPRNYALMLRILTRSAGTPLAARPAPGSADIKPGNIRRIAPSPVATRASPDAVLESRRAKAAPTRSTLLHPNLASNSAPAMEAAVKRPAAQNQPINAAIRIKATCSAAGA